MPLSHLTSLLTSLTPPPPPKPTYTGLIHRAPLPTNHPSTFAPAPNEPTTAFAPALVTGTAYRRHVASFQHLRLRTLDDVSATAEGDGSSWVEEVRDGDGDGWRIGYEKATQMVVKRKGRSVFRFEAAMVEGWGRGLREDEFGGDGDGDGYGEVEGQGRLEDGFEYRAWVDEDEEMDFDIVGGDCGGGEKSRCV